MAKKTDNTCRGKVKSGTSCLKIAGPSGYCHLHDPKKLREQKQKKKALKKQEDRLYELINMVISVSRAKGWDVYCKSVDQSSWQYATISASRTEGYEEVTALVEISCNSKISISTEKTSFHSYGLDSLRRALSDGLNSISWVTPIKDEKPKQKQPDFIFTLLRILRRFDILVRQFKHRYANREPIHVNDEYDVQYILHALLRGLFADVRPEEVSWEIIGVGPQQLI